MQTNLQQIDYFSFSSFEQLVDFFVQETGIFFPKLSHGPKSFFAGFTSWLARSHRINPIAPQALILPEPAQGLAFPDPFDVLSAALSHRSGTTKDSVLDLMKMFGLNEEQLTQPVCTLSGGELLQLNFAKAYAQKDNVSSLVACNPLFWLNPLRYGYWNLLTEAFFKAGLTVKVAAMSGDPVLPEKIESEKFHEQLDTIDFALHASSAEVHFPEIKFPVFHAAKVISYEFPLERIPCRSPMLITGDNGAGKSVFARVLAGIFPLSTGRVFCEGFAGNNVVRLLFQESASQMFAQSVISHRQVVLGCSLKIRELAECLFKQLCQQICMVQSDQENSLNVVDSMLMAKIGLIAERLAGSPALLILDEPGWGLSSADTQKLVYYTTRLAHSMGIAVAIISHQPQWLKFAASRLHLSRTTGNRILVKNCEVNDAGFA